MLVRDFKSGPTKRFHYNFNIIRDFKYGLNKKGTQKKDPFKNYAFELLCFFFWFDRMHIHRLHSDLLFDLVINAC